MDRRNIVVIRVFRGMGEYIVKDEDGHQVRG